MSPSADDRISPLGPAEPAERFFCTAPASSRPGGPADSAPTTAAQPGRLLHLICTGNPFYVLSAGLFLFGLWVSFGGQTGDVEAGALMGGLAGYTLLLAATGCLLVRFGNVWDDVRTVLLLAVLLFLATSVTFDELLIADPVRGAVCFAAGWLFAAAVSEVVLRTIRLRLPPEYRIPYHLILALFFFYPVALRPLTGDPRSEPLMWVLAAFPAFAGLTFLTLLPAVWRGPAAVRDNGSPWRWPLYPWALFGLLALAVPARSFLLCWSMHLLAAGDRDAVIFGLYFLVPFAFALAVLLLEGALVESRAGRGSPVAERVALAAPLVWVLLAVVGHSPSGVYGEFLRAYTARLGDPLTLACQLTVAFHAYAALRGARGATEALTGSLVGLAFIGPETLFTGEVANPTAPPVLLAGLLQVGLGLRERRAWRCLVGASALVTGVTLAVPSDGDPLLVGLVSYHVAIVALLILGSTLSDPLATVLRAFGAGLAGLAVLGGMLISPRQVPEAPAWVVLAYAPALIAGLAVYGLLLRDRICWGTAAGALAVWVGLAGARGYAALRLAVAGLDQITLGLALFGVAVAVSLAKAGVLPGVPRAQEIPPEAPPSAGGSLPALEGVVADRPE